jgi:hypothetical protein
LKYVAEKPNDNPSPDARQDDLFGLQRYVIQFSSFLLGFHSFEHPILCILVASIHVSLCFPSFYLVPCHILQHRLIVRIRIGDASCKGDGAMSEQTINCRVICCCTFFFRCWNPFLRGRIKAGRHVQNRGRCCRNLRVRSEPPCHTRQNCQCGQKCCDKRRLHCALK